MDEAGALVLDQSALHGRQNRAGQDLEVKIYLDKMTDVELLLESCLDHGFILTVLARQEARE